MFGASSRYQPRRCWSNWAPESDLGVAFFALLARIHTGIVHHGIEPAELRLYFFEHALNRFVILNVDLDRPDPAASRREIFHDRVGRLFGFDPRSSAEEYLIGFFKARKRSEHFQAKASVYSRHQNYDCLVHSLQLWFVRILVVDLVTEDSVLICDE